MTSYMTETSIILYKTLDLTGQSCAGVVGELSGVYEEMRPGEYVDVLIKSDSGKKDILAWASRVGARVREAQSGGAAIRLLVDRVK